MPIANRTDLLETADTLAIDGVPGDDHHHGQGGLHQRQGAVLQLPSQDTLAVSEIDINNVMIRASNDPS